MGYPAKNIRQFLKENKWSIKLQLLTLKQNYIVL
jgi:hypothetical protein